jgi:hypothetical protein
MRGLSDTIFLAWGSEICTMSERTEGWMREVSLSFCDCGYGLMKGVRFED